MKALNAYEINFLKLDLKFLIPIKRISQELVSSYFESLSALLNHLKLICTEAYNSLETKLIDFSHSYSGTQVDLGDLRIIKENLKELKTSKTIKI